MVCARPVPEPTPAPVVESRPQAAEEPARAMDAEALQAEGRSLWKVLPGDQWLCHSQTPSLLSATTAAAG